jgi:hypothetical protein
MAPELKSLIKQLKDAEGRDFEGSRTFRVHVNVAEQLMKYAYDLGRKGATSEAKGGDGKW